MKRLAAILCTCLLIAGAFYVGQLTINSYIINRSLTHNDGEYVVLLHGLGRTSYSMQPIGLELVKQGYRVLNVGYPSRSDTIEHLVENHLKKALKERYTNRDVPINFVTHSMGGIMVRHFLAHTESVNVNRVVMLAPPNNGSFLADERSQNRLMNIIMGPALRQLTTDESSFVNSLPEPDFNLGIIAGEYDEKVSVENTQLEGVDLLVVPREHTFIMQDDEVINAIVNFLTHGTFNSL